MPSSASSMEQKSMRRPGRYGVSSFQSATSRSWIELNWSLLGDTSCSQYHCTTAASRSDVGVSALYSRSLGGCAPSYTKSNLPYNDGGSASHDDSISGTALSGMPRRLYRRLSMTC